MLRLSLVRLGFLSAGTFCLVQMGLLFSLDNHLLLQCSEGGTGAMSGNIACHNRADMIYGTSTSATAPSAASSAAYNNKNMDPVYDNHIHLETDVALGVPQTMDPVYATAITDRLDRARSYMREQVAVNSTYAKVRNTCKLTQANCTYDAALGRCSDKETSGKMSYQCAPVCETCELTDYSVRCPMPEISDNDINNHNTLHPGDLDRTFRKIVANPLLASKFGMQVLSRPSYAAGDSAATANLRYQVGGPWVVLFDNLLTDAESDQIIEMGAQQGYQQSVTDVNQKRSDGTALLKQHPGRTSTNAWCVDACPKDPTVEETTARMAEVTGIPVQNYEFLQILKYTKGQFFNLHNDYIDQQKSRQPGVRILTLYVYLSDVEEGGGTHFPSLNLTVTPKKGRAILWPSVLNTDPNSKDARTNHQALPVIRGVKYGFNAWIHQRDFRGPHRKGCH
jgi:prolyl 4-hydroxylase